MLWQIELGIYQTAARYEDVIRKSDIHISITRGAELTLRSKDFVCETVRTEVELRDISIDELGFKDGAFYEQILKHAEEKKYRVCPLEVGPAIRLAHRAQPHGQGYVIASQPCSGRLFQIYRDSLGLTLGSLSLPSRQFLVDTSMRLLLVQY